MLRQSRQRKPGASAKAAQKAELFLLAADTPERLAAKASTITARASHWTPGEFARQARESACRAKNAGEFRAAVVAANPAKLSAALQSIAADPFDAAALARHAAFTGRAGASQRVVFVFPSCNRATLKGEHAWRQRFWECRTTAAELDQHRHASLPGAAAKALTSFEASFAGWRLMQRCNINPAAVIGVGSGELLACAAAGVADEEDLLPLAIASATEGAMNGALCQVAFDDPLTPLFSASTGMQVEAGSEAKAILAGMDGGSARFEQAMAVAAPDLLIEIGPGSGLGERASEMGVTALSTETYSGPVECFLSALGAAFAAGLPVNTAALYEDRRLEQESAPLAPVIMTPATMPASGVLHA